MWSAAIVSVRHSRAGAHIAGLVALAAVTAGRVEAQGLPVRATIGVQATVLPPPSPAMVVVDTTGALAGAAVRAASDSTAADPRRPRPRRVVVSYTGT